MKVKTFDFAFYFKDEGIFKCDNYRRCPRYVLYRKTGVHHQKYLNTCDSVMEAMVNGAGSMFAVGEKTIQEQTPGGMWTAIIPTDSRGLPVVVYPVLSSSFAKHLIAGGDPVVDEIMIAGWFSHKFAGSVVHIHYVQPKTLYYYSQAIRPFYRPYFIVVKDDVIHVNMGPTKHTFTPVEDGLFEMFKYYTANKIPKDRPKAISPKVQLCPSCPYDVLCHTAENRKIDDLSKIADLNLPVAK